MKSKFKKLLNPLAKFYDNYLSGFAISEIILFISVMFFIIVKFKSDGHINAIYDYVEPANSCLKYCGYR